MKWTFLAMALLALCSAACATVGQGPAEQRLLEAQREWDEGVRLEKAGEYTEAMAHAQRALELREAALGEIHPEVATALSLLGVLCWHQGDYEQAGQLLERTLAIREQTLGLSHPAVATALHNLASLYRDQGLYQRAAELAGRALSIREAAFGDNHPSVASSLHGLANIYWLQKSYERARPLYERALSIWEAAPTQDDVSISAALANLASICADQGFYEEAEQLFKRALARGEAARGKEHPAIALSLNGLADLYAEQGHYWLAEPLYQRALAIRQAALNESHPAVASSLNNLALLYVAQGDYGRAEAMFERALEIAKAALGEDHQTVAAVLANLGRLYEAQGLHERAKPLYERAIALEEAAFGEGYAGIATSLNGLANVYAEQGLYDQAEQLYVRAQAVVERSLGRAHPTAADSLNNLAMLHAERGRYAQAEQLYERALAIKVAALGETHPEVTSVQNNLARLYLARQQLDEALPLFEQAFSAFEQHLRKEALGFSEARLGSFLRLRRADDARVHALAREHLEDERVRRLALTAALLHKGRSVEEAAATSLTVYRGLGPADRELFNRLRALRTRLSEKSLAGPGALPLAAHRKALMELAAQGDELEAELSRRSAPLRALSELPPPAEIIDRVAAALPGNGALVEMVAYEYTPPSTYTAQPAGELRYLALILFANGRTRALDLGPAAPIEQAIQELCGMLKGRAANYQPAAQGVYQLVFRPLLPALGKARHLFLSPDGQLALIPFDALHDGRHFLADRFDFTYLTSGKDLLPRPKGPAPAHSVVVLADPDFSAGLVEPSAERASPTRSASVERLVSRPRTDLADLPWPPLPGTRQEAEAIQRLLPQARLLIGRDATKDALLQLETPGILHIATHGFFREDAATPRGTRGIASSVSDMGSAVYLVHPMLRSGLVLAGAHSLAASPDSGRLQKSLVAALELAGLDLWGTQLVVLSACDTGRGEVKLGQGVYGLRRALVMAGAQTVVTSLWKVDDQVTSELMELYYRHLLAGQGRASALRQAMRVLRRTHPHPHDWAPFIALGQDTPLQLSTPSPR